MIQGRVEGSFNRVFEMASRLETIEMYVGPLLEAWTKVLIEDNRRGVMMGIDGDGQPMKPTKYRLSLTQTGAGKAGDKFFNFQGQAFENIEGPNEFYFANLSGSDGIGYKPGPPGNLKTSEYRKMTGPPLAPRGPASRVISNYVVQVMAGSNMVGVEGGWNDVVSARGVEFLPFHFAGYGSQNDLFASSLAGPNRNLPRRNLVGLRQWGKTQARKELNSWVKWLMTVAQPGYFQRSAKHAPKYVRPKRTPKDF